MPIPDFAHGIQISFLDTANRARMKGHGATATTTSNPTAGTTASATPTNNADGTQTASSSMPLSFDDIVDIVNPLQHLPVISTLYQHYANDPINTFPKIAGDTLYGGPLGLLSSVADTAFEKITGKSFGDTVLAWVTGDKTPAGGTAVASAAKTAPANGMTSIASPAVAHATNSMPVGFAAPKRVVAAGTPRTLMATSASQGPNLDPASFNALSAFLHDKGIDGDTSQRTLDAYRRTMQLGTELPPGPQQLH